MSIVRVKSEISKALRDSHVSNKEMDKILNAAKPGVSNGEAKAIGDLYQRVTTAPSAPPGAAICFPTTVEPGALNKLEAFISAKSLPIGDQKDVMRDAINDLLSRARLGPPRKELPRSLPKLMELPLHEGPQPLGGWQRHAYVDVAKKRFYLVETRPTLDDNTRCWGPISLPKAKPAPAPSTDTVSPARADQLRDKFGELNIAGLINYSHTGLPLGVRTIEVPLMRERHPDGYAYAALVPVGALTPTAPVTDPNTVDEFYIRRTGGFGGLTDYAGPFSLRD